MKRIITLLVIIIILFRQHDSLAQPEQKLKMEEAVVFLSGAELTSSAKVRLAKGENEIVFNNVAGDVKSQSITVGATNGVIVESATFQNYFLGGDKLSPGAKVFKDSIEVITRKRDAITEQLGVVNLQIAVLSENKKVSGDNTGLSVAELTKLLDLIGSRLEGYTNQRAKLNGQIMKLNELLGQLTQQQGEEQKKSVPPGGQILVKFYAKEATESFITIDYVVPDAGWTPAYDIMADGVNVPIKLAYKANIFQTTGISWDKVKLSLNSGNPNEGVSAPIINPWYLAFYRPQAVSQNTYQYNAVLGRNEIAMLPTTQITDVVATTPGVYQSQRGRDASMGGARSNGTLYIIDGVQVQGSTGVGGYQAPAPVQQSTSINQYVSVDNAGVNTTFEIELPYTIPSDGKEHLVAIKKFELPATYRYYAVPKLDKDVFLQAQVTNWEDLNLLPGQTNIFYEGTYVGQGMLDVRNVKDTFTLSLGRDKKIVVKRDRDTKRRTVRSIGSNVRETFAYSITVRNARKENIHLTIIDQMPVSNDKDIVLEAMEDGGGEPDERTGVMRWGMDLKPNETRKLEFGFTVKYPKGKVIGNLK